jgi:hypothetical protein
MGYETRLHIGTTNDYGSGDKCGWHEIATIDLCKVAYEEMGELINRVRNAGRAEEIEEKYKGGFKFVEMYQLGSDEPITEDQYGDALVAVPAAAVLYAMKHDNSKEPYRRFPPAIALLESIVENFDKDEIYCILYGH